MKTRRRSQPKPARRPLLATLQIFVALFLVLCPVQPSAYAQDANSPPAPQAAASTGAGGQAQGLTPAQASAGAALRKPDIDCNDPLPGQQAKVINDDEIFLVSRSVLPNTELRTGVINYDITSSALQEVMSNDWTNTALLTPSEYLAAAAGDLNGTADGQRKDRLIAGFRNAKEQISAWTMLPTDTKVVYDWWGDYDGRTSGGNLKDVDVAAGNLDMSADGSDEVALFFRDDAADYHLIALDGLSDGHIGNADDSVLLRYWEDDNPGRERGDIHHAALATGDLNGDGYDNEVVTAFKDRGKDLQVVVMRPDTGAATFKSIFYWDSYTGNPKIDNVALSSGCDHWANYRPIDVATGDLDGDHRDEVVVAARSGICNNDGFVHLLVFDFKPEDASHNLTVDTSMPIPNLEVDLGSSNYEAAPTVSVAAGDLDGDGYDEIALGYMYEYTTGSESYNHERPSLITYEYVRAYTPEAKQYCAAESQTCLRKAFQHTSLPSYDYTDGDNLRYAALSLATGDVDADGMFEIALANIDPTTKEAVVRVFDAQTSLSQIGSLLFNHGLGFAPIYDLAIAMSDYDGDDVWGTYIQGQCYQKGDVLVQAVLRAPPFWPEESNAWEIHNEYDTWAKFAGDTGKEQSDGTSTETTMGMSAEMEKEFKIRKVEITADFGREWEKSVLHETTYMTSTHFGIGTRTGAPIYKPSEDPLYTPSWSGVLVMETDQWCYDYSVPDGTDTIVMPVCVTQDTSSPNFYRTSTWYADAGGRNMFADTWVPVGMNLAADTSKTQRIASQRTTWSSSQPYGDAWRAIDGNRDGVYPNGSIAQTQPEVDPYWQVDLGGWQWIDAIQVWNRTDCCTNQLSNFYVLVTEDEHWPTACTVGGVIGGVSCSCDDPVCMKDQHGVWDTYIAGDAGRPTVIPVNGYGRHVRIQRETGTVTGSLNVAEVEVYGMPGTPDQWPKSISPSSVTSVPSSFTLTWRNGRTQTVSRPLYLVWSKDVNVNTGEGIEYSTGVGTGREQLQESGTSQKHKVGLEIKMKHEASYGTNQKVSHANSWTKEIEFGFNADGLPDAALTHPELYYSYKPYFWTQQAVPEGGGIQEYLVLDYLAPTATPVQPGEEGASQAEEQSASPAGPLAVPEAPVVNSSTHPNPDTWYTANSATFAWSQPPGDTAVVDNYSWSLDQSPDTVLVGHHWGLRTDKTFDALKDGVWYMHVRAGNEQEEWGPAGHRMIRVDTQSPQVSLTVDPPHPTGNGNWYITPLTATVSATDGAGSGVAAVEVSTDGVAWQPYTAPLQFGADTPGTTVYARARDAVGHASVPVTTTFQIDRTPPDSHVTSGVGPGAWIAEVRPDVAGNDELVLAGAIADNLSGRAGMVLEHEGTYWNAGGQIGAWLLPGAPNIEANWVYTTTNDLGAGYHIFSGRAIDEAGNQEAEYEIGRVKWFPKASPDLRGSTVESAQTATRPGDEILFSLVARNAGFQEAYVSATATLPHGLEPVLDWLPPTVVYDPTARTLTWPPRLLWPGWSEPHLFLGKVDAGLGATSLEVQGTFHASWPNTDLLPPDERRIFEDREQTVGATTRVAVNPALPADADLVPPWSSILLPPGPHPQIAGADVSLTFMAAPDAERMYLREWTVDPDTGEWIVSQNSGWINYTPTLTWTLSPGQGVKYLGVWTADTSGNVASLTESNLTFVNRMDGSQVLPDGQRIQYRGLCQEGARVTLSLATVSGDPDAYVWGPRNGFLPYPYTEDVRPSGESEYLTKQFGEPGRYLLEVRAVGATEYNLALLEPDGEPYAAMAGVASAPAAKSRPEHPLAVSDPLSAGQVGPAVTLQIKNYLPLLFRGN